MSTNTNEHPILFSGPMIRAILDGRKTQTRRVINPQPKGFWGKPNDCLGIKSGVLQCVVHDPNAPNVGKVRDEYIRCPYGVPGDRLIVRESWRYYDWTEDGYPQIQYQADGELRWVDPIDATSETIDKIHAHWATLSEDENFAREGAARDMSWRPSIHMFHCFSRFRPVVKRVWVERVQEISKADVIAEGIDGLEDIHAGWHQPFAELWDSINAKRGHGWDTNPWVWCVEFERVEGER